MAEFQHPERFLNLEDEYAEKETSAVWILPLPLERTTSFQGGTAYAPAAILEVSFQIERYDEYVHAEAAHQYGIHSLPTFLPQRATVEEEIAAIQSYVQGLTLADRLLVTLGGEHTITPGLVAGLAPRFNNDLVLVQIDAHGDLRDAYEGTAWSHACAIRRCMPYVSQVLQFGIRTFGLEEIAFLNQVNNIKVWSGEALKNDKSQRHLEELRQAVTNKSVYLTIDVDGFDPSVFPHTGTPVPGGLDWYTGLEIVRTVAKYAHVVAFDCVELSVPDSSALGSAHSAAVLVYKTINMIMQARGKITPIESAQPNILSK